jgi:hypothetical protein
VRGQVVFNQSAEFPDSAHPEMVVDDEFGGEISSPPAGGASCEKYLTSIQSSYSLGPVWDIP